ncbi:hypothetical protein PR048_028473 [Dryococelus australis]|uniref:Uncharacterized protein n=1 Tax=Dryococelus australis TaxID=614101 RepID=A0ABQ9GAM6_9NEOP|nr:hypothetical protein PR048_028473 [Dryococelus australis]
MFLHKERCFRRALVGKRYGEVGSLIPYPSSLEPHLDTEELERQGGLNFATAGQDVRASTCRRSQTNFVLILYCFTDCGLARGPFFWFQVPKARGPSKTSQRERKLRHVEGLLFRHTGTDTDAKRNTKCRSKFILLVDLLICVHIQNTTTANAAWENFRKAFQDDGLTRKICLLPRERAELSSAKEALHAACMQHVNKCIAMGRANSNTCYDVSTFCMLMMYAVLNVE